MEFESLKIDRCQNDKCDKIFTEDNVKIVVWLYGVILLTKNDPKNSVEPSGYVGFTCPKCLNTSLFSCTTNDVRKFKSTLDQNMMIHKPGVDDHGNIEFETIYSFDPSLVYYAPFSMAGDHFDQFGIVDQGFSPLHFYDEFNSYPEENHEVTKMLCSYDSFSGIPAGNYFQILWFKSEDIPKLQQIENEGETRIFTRYFFWTELMEKVESLIAHHYYIGMRFDEAKAFYIEKAEYEIEQLRKIAYEKDMNLEKLIEVNGLNDPQYWAQTIEKNKVESEQDISVPGKYLDLLTADPYPLGGLLSQGRCSYLWTLINPFKNHPLPKCLVDELDDDLNDLARKKREWHHVMVSRIRPNFTKQYVQDFLRDNVSDFMEKYEDHYKKNLFSYAHIWELKERYLELLYKATNKGLRDEVPYAMHREGEGWRIVFEGKAVSGLRGKGFLWIYHIISNPNEKVFYRALHQQFNDNQNHEGKATWDDQLSLSDSDVHSNNSSVEELQIRKRAYEQLVRDKDEARSKGDTAKSERTKIQIVEFIKFLDDQKEKYQLKNDDKELYFPILDFEPSEYKMINDKIKKNYRDAMKKLKSVNPDLHTHFTKRIKSDGGAFVYTASDDFEWHLS